MAKMDPTSYDYREIACPVCGANAGSYCKRPSGHSGPIVQPHQQRREAVHLMWQQEELTKYGRIITTWDEAPATPALTSGQLSLF